MVEQGRYEGRGDANVIEQKARGGSTQRGREKTRKREGRKGEKERLILNQSVVFLFKMYKSA